MAEGQLKRYRIKDKEGNTKDVTYDPECGLSPQEFLTKEIARFNLEKEAAAKDEAVFVGLDEKKQSDENSDNDYQDVNESPAHVQRDARNPEPSAPKKEKSLASIMAGKSGIKLSSIAVKRNTDAKKNTQKPKGISRDSYVPKDRLVITGVKKS